MEQKQFNDSANTQIECNCSWDIEEKQAFINAGGGWDGIAAVIELDQRRFYGI